MKKIFIFILIFIFSISIINAQETNIKWTLKSVSGSGEKCNSISGSIPFGKIYPSDYAIISVIGDNLNINSCSSSKSVILVESNSFKLMSKTATIQMNLPTYSGAKYEIGIDNSNFKLLENVWDGNHKSTKFDCIKNQKTRGNSPIFSTYTIKTDKFLDGKKHKLTIRASKLDSKCPLSLTSKSKISSSKNTISKSNNNMDNDNNNLINSINNLDIEIPKNSFFNILSNLFSSGSKQNGIINLNCPVGYKKINVIDSQNYCEKISVCNNNDNYIELSEKEKIDATKISKGSISKINGRAVIERGIKTFPAKIGTKLYPGDKINVEEGSRAKINLKGSEILTITEKTSFKIPDPKFKVEKKSPIDIFFSKIWCETKTLLKGDSFEIKTPTATAGVRG